MRGACRKRECTRKARVIMDDLSNTQYFTVETEQETGAQIVLSAVYEALREKGYNPVNQIVGYIIVFCGHVHKWDEQEEGGVHYLTLDSMSEANNPEPGTYLIRVHVKADGTLSWEHVRMNYTPKK